MATPSSPPATWASASVTGSRAEILVLLKGIDETFSQAVHARSSYRAEEIVWNARFSSILDLSEQDQRISLDVSRIHDHEPLEGPHIVTAT